MQNSVQQLLYNYKSLWFTMFSTVVCVLFLIKALEV